MSKQLTFTLACAAVLSAVIPGAAGYFSARMDAVTSAERQLRMLETRLQSAETRPASLPKPCDVAPPPTLDQPFPAALGDRPRKKHRPVVPINPDASD